MIPFSDMKYLLVIWSLALFTTLSAVAGQEPVCSSSSGLPCFDVATGERLIGGTVADPAKWPNSVWIGNCSATVVGERVVASAAHCMRNGATISFSKGASRYRAKCTHHPEYRRNSTADWALCVTDSVVEGGQYEILNTDPGAVAIGTVLTNSGYGCQKWGGKLDGKFRVGEVPVTRLPSGSNYDIVTRGNVALCSGDSGGASFLVSGEDRKVVAVNSRSNTTTTSYMPAWHAATAQAWGKSLALAAGVKICGYHQDAVGCRKAAPQPILAFRVEGRAGYCAGEVKPEYESGLKEISSRVKDALDSVNE